MLQIKCMKTCSYDLGFEKNYDWDCYVKKYTPLNFVIVEMLIQWHFVDKHY